MEGLNGLFDFVHIKELKLILMPDDRVLKIDLVVIAMPESTKIAQVFIDLGVKHVIAFDFEHFAKNPRSVVRAQEYIQAYCLGFYNILLRNDGTVEEAFERTVNVSYDILEYAIKEFTFFEPIQEGDAIQ